MNILVITQYYFPEDFRINDICEALVNKGHSVTVVTGVPNYPSGEVFDGYMGAEKRQEIRNGVSIYRCNNKPRHSGFFNLAINYITYVSESTKILKKIGGNYDIIYVYQMSPITMAIPGIRLSRRKTIPLFYYVLDVWPESVRDMRAGRIMSVKNPIYILSKFLSKRIYHYADLIAVKCKEFQNYLAREASVPYEKMVLLYEHAEQNYLSIPDIPEDNGVIDFMYLGNIGHASNCESILQATKKLIPNNPFQIHFVGDGSELDNIKKLSQKLGLEDVVIFHGRHPQSEINRFYKIADCCLLTLSNRTAIGLTPPAKLPGYMAAARPIVGAIDGASKSIIKESNCGFCVGADDIEGLAANMQKIINQPEILKGLGSNGRKFFIEHFTLEHHINMLEDYLNMLKE